MYIEVILICVVYDPIEEIEDVAFIVFVMFDSFSFH